MEKISNRIGIFGAAESLIGGRSENQDHFGYAETPLGLLVVVCDGMGGGPAGRTASTLACESIIRQVSNSKMTDNPKKVLYDAIVASNNALLGAIAAKPELQGMGTTCVCLLVNHKHAYIAHVGDSRCYHLRRGQYVFRTSDHSYVGELVRRNTISEEEARQSRYSNVITRAIGVGQELEPDIDEVNVKPGDRFALMTDGIWGAIPETELVENLSQSDNLETLVPSLAVMVDHLGVNEGGGHDNLTLAMVQLPSTNQAPLAVKTVNQKFSRISAQQTSQSGIAGLTSAVDDDAKQKINSSAKSTPDADTGDSNLHITITELADESTNRRKNILIWTLSILLAAVIGLVVWLLLRDVPAENKEKQPIVDTRTQIGRNNTEHDLENDTQNKYDREEKSEKNVENIYGQQVAEHIIDNKDVKHKDDADNATNKDFSTKEEMSGMTDKQRIIYNSAVQLQTIIDKYRHAEALKKGSQKWTSREDAIRAMLKDISQYTKKGLSTGNPNSNPQLREQISEIDKLSRTSMDLLDGNYGRPSKDTEKALKKIIKELNRLARVQ